jgi:hypothetical protein
MALNYFQDSLNDNEDDNDFDLVAAEDEDRSDVWNIENEGQNHELQGKNKSEVFYT